MRVPGRVRVPCTTYNLHPGGEHPRRPVSETNGARKANKIDRSETAAQRCERFFLGVKRCQRVLERRHKTRTVLDRRQESRRASRTPAEVLHTNTALTHAKGACLASDRGPRLCRWSGIMGPIQSAILSLKAHHQIRALSTDLGTGHLYCIVFVLVWNHTAQTTGVSTCRVRGGLP